MSLADSTWAREDGSSSRQGDPEMLLEHFERDWEQGKAPALEDVLRQVEPSEDRGWLLQELVKIDLEYRWRARRAHQVELLATATPEDVRPAEGPRLEEYLARYPELGSALLDLLGEEYRARRLGGDRPSAADYRGRFPELSTALADLLPHIDAEIAAEGGAIGMAPDDFEVLGELGRGATGVVFKARQRSLGRLVALKMLHTQGPTGRRELGRFQTEARLAANLVHPNIVHIHEIGTAAGRPYLCLEYVGGGTLSDRLAAASLPPADAAGLLETLARAVHHAHLRGVVHRDLKPANVLLTDDGTPKITDFGLAKEVDRESGHTQTGAVLGTPCYMAPEQAAGHGREVGPAADVHALGAILYEALTGRPPFKGTTVLETLEQVKNDEPIPPRRFRPGLPRDLETICLKCLEKAPAGRYTSALDLAEDLRRFRAGEPIQARRVGLGTRLVKWARRRPAVAALAALCVTAGLALLIGGWWYNLRLQGALTRAERNRERAETNLDKAFAAVDRMLTQVADERLRNVPEMEEVRKQLLTDAVSICEGLLGQEEDAGPRARSEVGRARWRLGKINNLLGQRGDALEHYRQARFLQAQLVAAFPAEATYRADLGRTCLDQGALLSTLGRKAEAETAIRQAIGLWEEMTPTPSSQSELATCYLTLGGVVQSIGRITEAEGLLARAVELREQLAKDHPEDRSETYNLALVQFHLGNLHMELGRRAKAREAYRTAVSLFERLDRLAPGRADYQDGLAGASTNLAQSMEPDQIVESERRLRQSVEVREHLVRDHPRTIDYQQTLGVALHSLGLVLWNAHREAEAVGMFERAARVREEILRKVPGDVDLRTLLAETYGVLGLRCGGQKQQEQAAKWFDKAIELLEQLAKEYPEMTRVVLSLAGTCNHRAMTLRWGGKPADAMPWHDRAVRTTEELLAKDPRTEAVKRFTMACHGERGATLGELKRYAEAVEDFSRALELADESTRDYLWIQRIYNRAQQGDHTRALAEVNVLVGKPGVSADVLYDLACGASRAADAASRDMALTSPERLARADECARRAVELLKMSQAKGGFKTFTDVLSVMNEDALRPLRQREDYRKFLTGVLFTWR
jgi:tetratricopeptide (TPR) repeat protein